MVTKLISKYCDKTQKVRLWQNENLQTQNCDITHEPRLWQNWVNNIWKKYRQNSNCENYDFTAINLNYKQNKKNLNFDQSKTMIKKTLNCWQNSNNNQI